MLEATLESLLNTHPNAGPRHWLAPSTVGALSDKSEDLAVALMSRVESFKGPDLRQGRYKSQAGLDWRLPAATLVTSVLLSAAAVIGVNLYKAVVFNERRAEIVLTMEQVYKETFSAQGQLVNLPVQARQHVKTLKAKWQPPEERPAFFPLFSSVTQALVIWGQDYTSTLRQLGYVERDSAINLTLVTEDMAYINRLQQFFSDQGLQAAVLSASEEEGQFIGHMRVRHEPE
jgi:type II secretory pathway component PulL